MLIEIKFSRDTKPGSFFAFIFEGEFCCLILSFADRTESFQQDPEGGFLMLNFFKEKGGTCMKKIGFLVTACLVACGLFLTQPAFATSTCEDLIYSDYSGCWTIGENDTLITFEVATDNFGIYNFQSGESYSLSRSF